MRKANGVRKETPNQNLNSLVNLALSMGAVDAKLIDANSVVVSDWVRLKCQYGCGMFGKALTCPPNSPSAERMRQILSGYSNAILMRLPDESVESHDLIANLERSLFLKGFYRAVGLPAGPCERCKECNLQHCIHPRVARPSMEACSIDVYATARKNGFAIEVRKTQREKPTYFGLVLVE